MSSLPLGLNQVEIQRGLTTSSTAIFVPFTTQELFQNGKEALYYGINALSNNLIMVDRKLLKNPNGLILGTPGSGKSFSAKREIANCRVPASPSAPSARSPTVSCSPMMTSSSVTRRPSTRPWWSACMGRSSKFRPLPPTTSTRWT